MDIICNRYIIIWYTHIHTHTHTHTHAGIGEPVHARTHRKQTRGTDTRTHSHALSYVPLYNNIIYASGRLVKRVRRYIPVFGWLFFFRFFFFLPLPLHTWRTLTHSQTHKHTHTTIGTYGWRSFWNHFVYIYMYIRANLRSWSCTPPPTRRRGRACVRRVWYRYYIVRLAPDIGIPVLLLLLNAHNIIMGRR